VTDKQYVLLRYPDAGVCSGDDPESRIIMRPGQCLSDEFLGSDRWDEDSAENDAWYDAARRIENKFHAGKYHGMPSRPDATEVR
jgi:hypothetical protein